MPPGSVEHEKRWTKYWTGVKNLLDGRDVLAWERLHASIRQRAARLDDNPELYLLLRLSSWERRKELTGRIGGALWIRPIAEVIRMGFEELHQVRWLEEDRAFGRWSPEARARTFGAERPLDDTLAAKPSLASRFGLSTRSTLRWYLEGHTEYYAAAFVECAVGRAGARQVGYRVDQPVVRSPLEKEMPRSSLSKISRKT